MICERERVLRSFVRDNENCDVNEEIVIEDCRHALFSAELLRRLTFYCSVSIRAAMQVQQRTNVLKGLLRDNSFRDEVMDLVSSVCVAYPYSLTLKFYDLVHACFEAESREEYARVLPISSILRVNIEEMPIDEMCRVFQIVIEKMANFDRRILEMLWRKLFLSGIGNDNVLLRHEVLVLIRNLFIKFPYEMYSVKEHGVFWLLVNELSQSNERQQNEICSIMLQLTEQLIINDPEFYGILERLASRKHLYNTQLDLIEQIANFVDVGEAIIQQIRAESMVEGATEKHSKRLLATILQ